ncbi:PAS domain-containing protein [Lichenihabitans psoromatis]|uniref:PAS domain-containing protein n=1 Tax=Lichenihabitans psoromatis TaxID=2528642 RepID=UPI0010383BB2|nr:PAS domain-containing protein [Lichenihabitans psoromatis]
MLDLAGFRERSAFTISTLGKKILYANDVHLDMLGRTRGNTIGQSWEDWLTREDLLRASALFDGFLLTQKAYSIHTRLLKSDGSSVLIAAQCSMLRSTDPSGDLVLCEMMQLADDEFLPGPGRRDVLESVRDTTYELAALTGSHHFNGLSDRLMQVSSAAESTLEILSNAMTIINRRIPAA